MKALLVCSGGMSSAICAKALQEAATANGQDIQVTECGTQAFEEEVKKGYEIALVAPQIRHRFSTLESLAKAAGVPIILIKPQGYTPLGGKILLQQVNEELKK